VDAVDSSEAALEVARRNAESHKVADRIAFFLGDLLDALPGGCGPYDVVVSNPPYISLSDYAELMDDVRLFEPREALLDTRSPSGDGLGFYRSMASAARERAKLGAAIAVEVGLGQASAVSGIFAEAGWRTEAVVRDYGGIERVVVARRA